MIEVLIWVLVGAISLVTGLWVVVELDPSYIEHFLIKAYVFSKIMESRYTGKKVVIDYEGVFFDGKMKEFDVNYVISSGSRGIYYVGSMIKSAGTVYTKRGSVSFLPVTGRMVVRTK